MNSRRLRKNFWRPCFVFASLLLLVPATLLAQRSSNWRVYRASDGLQDSVCIGITISGRSGLWVHHTDRSTLSWLDGYDVRKVAFPGLAAAHIAEGRAGQIWAPFLGGVQQFQNGAWIRYPIKALAGKSDAPLLPLRQGQVLALAPERLISFSSEPAPEVSTVREAAATSIGPFTDMIRSRDGGAWIGGEHGIGKFASLRPIDENSSFEEHVADGKLAAENFSNLTEDDDGGITCIATSTIDGKKMAVRWDGNRWLTLPTSIPDLMQVWRGDNGSIWELGRYSLIHLRKRGEQWRAEDELIAAQYYEAAVEANGVFWIATSEGLYRYSPLVWQAATPPHDAAGSITIAPGAQQRLWSASTTDLGSFDGKSWTIFPLPDALKSSSSPAEVMVELASQTLLLGSSPHFYMFNPRLGSFTPLRHSAANDLTFVGAFKDGVACFQVHRTNSDDSMQLETYDGREFKSFLNVSTNIGIGSKARFVYAAPNGGVWVCAEKGFAFYGEGKWQTFDPGNGVALEVVGMVDAGQNKIWAAARDRILQFNGKDWIVVRANFDRINTMIKSRDGSIWVASNNGVHRFYKGDWVANASEEGLSSLAVRQVVEDAQGHVWAATARGLDLFHPEADNDPPEAMIQPVAAESISTDGNMTLEFNGRDRWKQTQADRLLFSYRIDEQEWSPMQPDHSVHFSDLGGGKHFFQVRAMDRNWNMDPKPALLEFFVPVPWFRETRLVLIASAAGLAVLFFAGLAFNRHRKLVRSYAQVEKIVDQRTRELEKANRDLFQSQKMNALGTLAAGIAHDFNSILSIIKGSAQIIETNVDNKEKIRTRVDRINTAVDQGAGIVKAMLGFSRSSDHQVAECDLNALIEDTIRLLGDRFQRDVEVKFEAAKKLGPVCVVKDFVQQIVLNFVLNAAEALPAPGKIVVRTGVLDQLPSDLALAPEPAAQYAFVEVEDFGAGIGPEIMPRIFEPFFTTKSLSTKRGTGLGLSMAYELAKEMKCGLSVRSKVGEGSTFMLILPVER